MSWVSPAEPHAVNRRPLPEWDDLGTLFVDGARALAVYLGHIIPLGILATVLALAVGGVFQSENTPDSLRLMAMLIVFAGFVLVTLASIAVLLYLPAAFTRFVVQDKVAAAFDVRENLLFIKRNLTNYGLVLLAILAASFLSQFGVILFCIGIFLASFGSSSVLGFVLGEVALKDPGSTSRSNSGSNLEGAKTPTTPPTTDSGEASYTEFLP